nr:hypothetical protein HmN_000265500 [Hymenolepis microstoma]
MVLEKDPHGYMKFSLSCKDVCKTATRAATKLALSERAVTIMATNYALAAAQLNKPSPSSFPKSAHTPSYPPLTNI